MGCNENKQTNKQINKQTDYYEKRFMVFFISDVSMHRVSLENSQPITLTVNFANTHSKSDAVIEIPEPLDDEPDNPVVLELTLTGSSNSESIWQFSDATVYIFRNIKPSAY